MRGMRLWVLPLCIKLSALPCADPMYLKNGDCLTGQIVSLPGGRMVLNAGLAGARNLDMTNVKTRNSYAAVEVCSNHGDVLAPDQGNSVTKCLLGISLIDFQ